MISKFLTVLRHHDGVERYLNGDCHHLALALHTIHCTGTLRACLRETWMAEKDQWHADYSHMVYVDPLGETWDIDGSGAQYRWTRQWNGVNKDELGRPQQTLWMDIDHPISEWLLAHGCLYRDVLVQRIVGQYKIWQKNPETYLRRLT